jgi:hypothetical protein
MWPPHRLSKKLWLTEIWQGGKSVYPLWICQTDWQIRLTDWQIHRKIGWVSFSSLSHHTGLCSRITYLHGSICIGSIGQPRCNDGRGVVSGSYTSFLNAMMQHVLSNETGFPRRVISDRQTKQHECMRRGLGDGLATQLLVDGQQRVIKARTFVQDFFRYHIWGCTCGMGMKWTVT